MMVLQRGLAWLFLLGWLLELLPVIGHPLLLVPVRLLELQCLRRIVLEREYSYFAAGSVGLEIELVLVLEHQLGIGLELVLVLVLVLVLER